MTTVQPSMLAASNTSYGPPSVLSIATVERPTPGPGELLIRVHASAVTEGDRRLRAADYPGMSWVLGRLATGVLGPRRSIGGSSYAGTVVAIGSGVQRFAVGDDVFGGAMSGAYGEYLVVPEDDGLARMPNNTSYAESAAIPYGGVTALVFLRNMAKVRPGERVLIVGASGGVGRMAVQLAHGLGAHVTGVCSREHDLVRSLGADELIDYTHEDFTQRNETWDVILDTTQGDHFRSFRRSLSPKGRYLSLYLSLRILFEMAVTAIRGGQRAMVGVAMGNAALMDEVRSLVEDGTLRATIAKRYPLDRIVEAHTCLESTRPRGSVIVDMSEEHRTSQSPLAPCVAA